MRQAIKVIFGAAGLLALLVSTAGCGDKDTGQKQIDDAVKKADATVRAFNPPSYDKPDRRHVAVRFAIVNGILELKPSIAAEVRPGKMPYRPVHAGDFQVIYKDAGGKELGHYDMENPTVARSCDADKGKTPEAKPLQSGEIEILLPDDPAIATLTLGSSEKELKSFDIKVQIRDRAIPQPKDAPGQPK